jgi:hypothetical protein
VAAEPALADLTWPAEIGVNAYLGVPVTTADTRPYLLCRLAARASPRPRRGRRELPAGRRGRLPAAEENAAAAVLSRSPPALSVGQIRLTRRRRCDAAPRQPDCYVVGRGLPRPPETAQADAALADECERLANDIEAWLERRPEWDPDNKYSLIEMPPEFSANFDGRLFHCLEALVNRRYITRDDMRRLATENIYLSRAEHRAKVMREWSHRAAPPVIDKTTAQHSSSKSHGGRSERCSAVGVARERAL